METYRDGYLFKCVITDTYGKSVETTVASMTVLKSEVNIENQPESVVNGVLGETYTFTVEATGENLSYEWFHSIDGGQTWEKAWFNGYNTKAMEVELASYRDGYKFYCVVTSGLDTAGAKTTDIVELKLQNS